MVEASTALKSKGRQRVPKGEMLERVGGPSYPCVWGWMREGTFPRGIMIGGNVYWYEDELDAWLAARPRQKLKGDPDAPKREHLGRPLGRKNKSGFTRRRKAKVA